MNLFNLSSFGFFIIDCKSKDGAVILSDSMLEILKYFSNGIIFAVPAIIIALIAIDVVKAVTSGKEDDMKKSQQNVIKRIVIGVVIVLLPVIMNIVLQFVGWGDMCKIW